MYDLYMMKTLEHLGLVLAFTAITFAPGMFFIGMVNILSR
jgi:hypothetical protein